MKRILLFALAICATSAFAVGIGNDNPPGGSAAQAQSQGQAQGQAQLQGQMQGQAQFTNVDINSRISNDVRNSAAAFANSSSNSASLSNSSNHTNVKTGDTSASVSTGDTTVVTGGNSLTVNEAPIPANTSVSYSGTTTLKNTPDVAIGNTYPTAPCMGGTNVGGSGPGFSLAFGTSWKDDECGKRETARSFAGLGLSDDAIAILCTSEYAAAAPSCIARQQPKE